MSFLKRFQTSLESWYQFSDSHNYLIKQYVIAFSGGVDSLVLLHCFKQIGVSVRAVHVHHGLQAVADDWVAHCQQVCAQLDLPLDVLYVDAKQKPGASPEESARDARYHALHDNLREGDCLVTAQHLNDQAETLLLQLFRTASTAGLSAMPRYKSFGDFFHIRPLLSFSREQIESYARQHDLLWVEDPSNHDISYDRNFIRKEIVPMLEGRWPAIVNQLSTVAGLQANNLQVLEDMAAVDLASAVTMRSRPLKICVFKVVSMLSISRLKQLSSPRLANLLRYWIIDSLAMQPTRNLLEEIENSLINSQRDANPNIIFSVYAFRKFQDNLYLLKTSGKTIVEHKLDWQPALSLKLPDLNLQLKTTMTSGEGLNKKLLDEVLTVSFRKGGEKFHPVGRRHSQSLKKILQETNMPPWERDVLPLVYLKDELIAVAGLWVSQNFSVAKGESGWHVVVENL